ncbi:MAG: hypothetical protein M3Z40_06065, partial [Bifidobacterium sp.]|nr:hypothetical protein [Bifidobacterium sp.]
MLFVDWVVGCKAGNVEKTTGFRFGLCSWLHRLILNYGWLFDWKNFIRQAVLIPLGVGEGVLVS